MAKLQQSNEGDSSFFLFSFLHNFKIRYSHLPSTCLPSAMAATNSHKGKDRRLLCTAVVVGLKTFEAFLKMAIHSEDPELIKQEADACNANPMYMQPVPRNRKRMEKGMNNESWDIIICYLRCSTGVSCCLMLYSRLRCKAYYRQVRNATDAEIASCSTLPILLIRGDPCKLPQFEGSMFLF